MARDILLSPVSYDLPQTTHMLFIDDDMNLPKVRLPAAMASGADPVGALWQVDLKSLHKDGALPSAQALAHDMTPDTLTRFLIHRAADLGLGVAAGFPCA